MSKITNQTWTSIALSATGISTAVTGAAAAGFTITNGTLSDGLGHIITFAGKAATNYSSRTVTIVGTDENGNRQTDVIAAGPNGVASVSSAKYFKTVTSIVMSGATSGVDTFDIGYTAGSAAAWIRPYLESVAPINIGIAVAWTSGTYSVSYTYDGVTWTAPTALSAKGASAVDVSLLPAVAWRQTFTAAGTTTLTFIQAGPVGN